MQASIDIWVMDFKKNWKFFLKNRKNLYESFVSILLLIAITELFKYFLIKNESIPGVLLKDQLLDILPSLDVSLFIFIVNYWVFFWTLLYLLAYPKHLLAFFQFLSIGFILRFILIFIIVLEPPTNLTKLNDPILFTTTYNGVHITKDLFFSGHMVSTLVCTYAIPNQNLKKFFGVLSITLAFLLLIQHIHYTIDILGAFIVIKIIFILFFNKKASKIKKEMHISPKVYNRF